MILGEPRMKVIIRKSEDQFEHTQPTPGLILSWLSFVLVEILSRLTSKPLVIEFRVPAYLTGRNEQSVYLSLEAVLHSLNSCRPGERWTISYEPDESLAKT